MHILTKKSTTTQDRLVVCVRELQGPGTAYTPAPLIQQIPNLIRYKKGEPADAHELLIALINDISEPILQLFQGQMASTVKCSSCDRITIKTENTQDISLHIEEDASISLEERLYDFFQPETLVGENAYWRDTCQKPCRATKTLSYTRTPTILIVHLKRLILGKRIQNHIPFDTALDLEPYMTPGHSSTQDMKLIGIISHQGTTDNGHYTAMTNKEDKWTLHNDAITIQTTTKHIHQTQAYILMYRKTEQSTGMGKSAPIDTPKKRVSQSRAKGNPNPRLETQQRRETPAPQLELPMKTPPGQNLPRQGRTDGGANPMNREGPSTENQKGLGTLFSTHDYIPLVLETKEEEEGGGTIEGSGGSAPSTGREEERERPLLQD